MIDVDLAASLPPEARAQLETAERSRADRSLPLGFGNEAAATVAFEIAQNPASGAGYPVSLTVTVARNDAYVLTAEALTQTGRRGAGFFVDRGTPERPLFTTTFAVYYVNATNERGSRTVEVYGDGRFDVLDGSE